MKPMSYIKHIMIILGFVLALSACTSSFVKPVTPEYQAGRNAAERVAKQDAIEDDCFFIQPVRQRMYRNLSAHLKSMGDQRSGEYKKGFSHGYERAFYEYMDLYCEHSEWNH